MEMDPIEGYCTLIQVVVHALVDDTSTGPTRLFEIDQSVDDVRNAVEVADVLTAGQVTKQADVLRQGCANVGQTDQVGRGRQNLFPFVDRASHDGDGSQGNLPGQLYRCLYHYLIHATTQLSDANIACPFKIQKKKMLRFSRRIQLSYGDCPFEMISIP